MTCADILIILPSRSSRPRVPVCFSCNRALYTSYIAIGGIVKVEFDIFDSQKRLKKFKSFSFDWSLVMIVSDTFAKWLFSLSGVILWLWLEVLMHLFLFQIERESFFEATKFESMFFVCFVFWKHVLKMSLCSSAFWILRVTLLSVAYLFDAWPLLSPLTTTKVSLCT